MSEAITNGKEYISLKDVADVIVGQIMTRVISKDGIGDVVPVLMPKAITSGIIMKNDLGEAILEKTVSSNKYTKEKDIVIKLSTPYDAAYVTKAEEGLLIPSFCAAIRITKNSKVDAKYLSAFLNSSYVRNLLSLMASGSSKPMIKINDIRALKIPDVPVKDMEDIGEAYLLSGKKKEVLREMIRAEEDLMENIVLASIKGGIRHE